MRLGAVARPAPVSEDVAEFVPRERPRMGDSQENIPPATYRTAWIVWKFEGDTQSRLITKNDAGHIVHL
jgi:hypothetical protein